MEVKVLCKCFVLYDAHAVRLGCTMRTPFLSSPLFLSVSQRNRQSTTCGQTHTHTHKVHTHTHTHKEKDTSRVLPHLTCPQGIIGERAVVGGVVEQKEGLHPWVHLLKPRDSLLLQLLQDVRGSPVPIVVLAPRPQVGAEQEREEAARGAASGRGRAEAQHSRSSSTTAVGVVGPGGAAVLGGGRSRWWGARAEAR